MYVQCVPVLTALVRVVTVGGAGGATATAYTVLDSCTGNLSSGFDNCTATDAPKVRSPSNPNVTSGTLPAPISQLIPVIYPCFSSDPQLLYEPGPNFLQRLPCL